MTKAGPLVSNADGRTKGGLFFELKKKKKFQYGLCSVAEDVLYIKVLLQHYIENVFNKDLRLSGVDEDEYCYTNKSGTNLPSLGMSWCGTTRL